MMLQVLVEEMLSGANSAFNMYPGLAFGAAELIAECGTPEQKKLYVERMLNGTWGGTMCLTEPQAGSDVGAAKSTARKNADGTYSIRGTKIFISGGDHDLAENIIHLVLARIEGAAPGTKGLSLFIVPKIRVKPDGGLLGTNDVSVGSIEHKMGINGVGDVRAELRRERRLRGRAGGRRRERRHEPDVQDDERRAHRGGHPGPGAGERGLLQRAGVREGPQAGRARRASGRIRRRRAWPSSSTRTCAACCWR